MEERHLSRRVILRRNNTEKLYHLAIVTIERDENRKIAFYSIDAFNTEEANVVYHDCDLVLSVPDNGEIILTEQTHIAT